MPASKPMKLKAARYNAIETRPNPVEKMISTDKTQETELDIQKQEFKMMICVIEEAIKQRKEDNNGPFYELIRQINNSSNINPNPKKLKIWCLALSRTSHKFDATCSDLVYTLLNLNWADHDNNLAIAYVMLLTNLVAAYPSCTEAMLEMLVKNFLYKEDKELEVLEMEKAHGKVHYAIKNLVHRIPQGEKELFHILYRGFPHKRESLGAYIVYVKNLLQLIEYTPSLQHKILTLIFERMIELDTEVQGQIDEIEDMEEGLDEFNVGLYSTRYSSTDFYKLRPNFEDYDDANAESLDLDIEDSAPVVIAVDIANGIQKLDCIIKLVLDYLDYSYKNGTQEQRMKLTETIFTIFEKFILYTIKSRYIQFIPFWYFSLDRMYALRFIKLLLHKLIDDEGKGIIQKAAAQYVASYIARAKYLDVEDVIYCMRALTQWATEYVMTHKNIIRIPDESKHEKFYLIVQTAMYIFCFRWKNFCEINVGNKKIWSKEAEDLKEIIGSIFCPLKYCVKNTVKMFSFISKAVGFMTCEEYTHIDNRNYSILSMEEYFPYDPFRLKTSQAYLEGLYQVWEGFPEGSNEEEE
ncbi:10251_t:CDS:2 [Funneliformis mosseae]|uniref:10251_t:CDS:1 n=1 Tax=Funneliformis mosseae TaxID=27381 RepID=A0A9N9EWT9_FUNMO|nr:10251_t:CDS:2 [Funneliformis mosseae]